MTDRRDLLALLGLLLGGAAPAVRAQGTTRVYRVGELRSSAPPAPGDRLTGMLERALRDRGYVVGRNLVLESRFAGGELQRLPELAREVLQARVEAVFTVGASATRAMRDAAPALPIVFFGNLDPIALGLARSLAEPGGNATGVLIAAEGTLAAKRLQLLHEALPRVRRVAVLAADDPGFQLQEQEVRKAAAELGLEVTTTVVVGRDYERAFAQAVAAHCEAMFVGGHTYFVRDRLQIIALAVRHRLPATYEWPEQADDGGFMAYGTSLHGTYDSAASHLDRILRGSRAGDLPVVQPTQFQLVINRATARALGVAIPQAVLLRADRLVE